MKDFILQHYNDYPQSSLQDFFKFLYQGEFGPGHLIADPAKNFQYLQTEFECLAVAPKEPIIDILDAHLCRLHLQVLSETTLNITTLQRFFEISAEELQGTVDGYYQKIQILRDLCSNGDLPFNSVEVDEFKMKIDVDPTNPVHHSEAFRMAYQPAYRVVEKRFCDFLPLFAAIDQLRNEKEQVAIAIDGDCANAQKVTEDRSKSVVIAIDGDCAAGKTTLAKWLAQVYDCNVIHMDHFFLRPEQQTDKRLAMPGGNIDYERFTSDVLQPLNAQKPFSYQPFNCRTQDFEAPISMIPKKLTIIEGSYSQHPELAANYDLKVFLAIPEHVQLERILKRNGEMMCEKFKNTWIPMEKRYAERFKIRENSHLQFDYLDA